MLLTCCGSFGSSDADATRPEDAGAPDGDVDGGVDGSADPNAVEEIAAGEADASEIVVDDAAVYWTVDRAATGTVRARAHGGSAEVRTLAGGQDHPHALTQFGDELVFAVGSEVRSIVKNERDRTPLTVVTAPFGNPVASVQRVAERYFFNAGSYVHRCDAPAGACATEPQYTGTAGVGRALVVDGAGQTLWFATPTAIKSVTTAFSITEHWASKDARALAVDETTVYFARDGAAGIWKIARTAAKDAPATPIGAEHGQAWSLAMDGPAVYFTAIDAGLVVKVPKDGGAPVVLASGLARPKGIAVRADRAFVVLSDGRIVALRTGG